MAPQPTVLRHPANLPLLLRLARTHLLSRKRQTLVATLGVTFGVSMYILMSGFMSGVNDLMETLILRNMPHVQIYNKIENERPSVAELWLRQQGQQGSVLVHHQRPLRQQVSLRNGLQIAEALRADPRVAAVSPMAWTQIFYSYNNQNFGGELIGVNILEYNHILRLDNKMVEGSLQDLAVTTDGILMGIGLARKLNLHKGDRITVNSADGIRMPLTVAGIYKLGITLVDDTHSFTTLSTTQKAMGKDPSYITFVVANLHDINQAQAAAAQYHARFGYTAVDWEQANAAILVSFTFRDMLNYVVSFTLLLVAGFGIYNIMNMTVYEKMRDIAILKATGFAGRDIVQLFLLQSGIIGVLGGVSGVLLGLGLCYAVSQVPFESSNILEMRQLPMTWNPWFYVFGLAFGVVTTLLAGWLPSRRAAHVDPVEIIRGQ